MRLVEIIKDMPSLDYIEFSENNGNGNKVEIFNNGNSIIASCVIEDEIVKSGQVIFTKKLIDTLKKLKEFQIELKGKHIVVKNGASEFKFASVEVAHQASKEIEDAKELIVNLEIVQEALKFVSKKEKRIQLTGVYVSERCVCATDSFILFDFGDFDNNGIIIPSELLKTAISVKNNEITIKYNKDRVCISLENGINYISGLIQGAYPDISKISKSSTTDTQKIELNSKVLKRAVANMTIIADEASTGLLEMINGKLKLTIQDSFVFEEEVENAYQEMKIALAKDKLELLASAFNEDSKIYYNGSNKPLAVKSEEKTICILPIKIEEGKNEK